MKAKLLPFMFLLSTLIPLILFGSTGPGIDRPSPIEVQAPNSEAKTTITDVLSAASALPRGPREILEEYQAEMARITQSFSGRMAAIAQAVQNGQLSSEQGQRLSTEQYQMAQMQFDLLSAWRDMLEQDLARTPSAKPEPAASTASEIVMVALPFSSLQLNPSLAQYLELTPSKSGAIQQLMLDERRNLQPLIEQLRITRERLLAATGSGPAKEKEVKRRRQPRRPACS